MALANEKVLSLAMFTTSSSARHLQEVIVIVIIAIKYSHSNHHHHQDNGDLKEAVGRESSTAKISQPALDYDHLEMVKIEFWKFSFECQTSTCSARACWALRGRQLQRLLQCLPLVSFNKIGELQQKQNRWASAKNSGWHREIFGCNRQTGFVSGLVDWVGTLKALKGDLAWWSIVRESTCNLLWPSHLTCGWQLDTCLDTDGKNRIDGCDASKISVVLPLGIIRIAIKTTFEASSSQKRWAWSTPVNSTSLKIK